MSQPPKILFAHPDKKNADAIIKNYGEKLSVKIFDNGDDLLRYTTNNYFDLIVIHSDISGMNGYECALLLLGAHHTKNVPIILIAPDNDKTAKWTKFNSESEYVTWVNSSASTELLVMEINRLLHAKTEITTLEKENSSKNILQGKLILAVDDMKVNLMALELIMNKAGCTLITASNGLEAIDLCTKNRFDLIFMDCRMPELDGYETTKQIRKYYQSNGTIPPIIALTAHSHSEDKEKCLKAGMHDYMTKPVQKEQILQVIRKWLQ